ncbi:hypothetical protein V5F40_22795 [Xanthobacter sp. DSM 14520]|uniref:hypothetical protein n=1 Tax=Xanthobacter autotrophicus (strain ATCC BAA-1158 / Py2) TaxID=78245 RepID=UPI0037296BC5
MNDDVERLYIALTRAELGLLQRGLFPSAAGGADVEGDLAALCHKLEARALRSADLVPVLVGAMHALRSYQYGNAAPDLAEGCADRCAQLLVLLAGGDEVLARAVAADPLAGLQALQKAMRDAGFVPAPPDTPTQRFAKWLGDGPKLAKAAGCYVAIKVTELPQQKASN